MLHKAAEILSKQPVRVAVTGGSGNICYSLLFRIASGALLGPSQPVILQIHDLPQMQPALKGVVMELQDCAFPLLMDVVATDQESTAFDGADYCFMVGSKPRGPGMERGDLLKQNGEIFIRQGETINKHASRNAKVIVVGNPANTNCLILQNSAPSIPKQNFTAMTRLDHNRGVFQLSQKYKAHVSEITNFCIWGNHSSTMYPDITNTLIKGSEIASKIDRHWYNEDFIPTVQQRGAAIIQARKASSAASAGNAALDHMRDWALGSDGQWVSMAVPSDLANGAYGVPGGLIFSYPVTTNNGEWKIVENLKIDEFSKEMIKKTTDELLSEREAVADMLKK